MSSYVDPKTGKIIYTDGSSTPSEGVYPSSYTGGTSGAVGTTGGAGTPTASPTGTSGVLYTDGAAALPTDSYGYAEWLRNNSYQNATDAANKARQEALLNKQNALVGADTAYKQGLATYGANAESLASKGLSNSGYGEYLTGKNYATARAEKAAANATYQGAMNDILYQENSAKQEADQLYAKTMIELKEKDKADAQTAYDALMNSAISGIDLGTLQADARWGSLSPDQTAAITSMVYQRALETRINNGETLDSIMASEEWGGLSTSAQGDLQNAYNVKVRGERYMNAERDAKAGKYTADTITTIDGWNEFTQAERDALTDLVDEAANSKSNTASTNYGTWLGAIKRGEATIDDIRNLAGYSDLSPDQKTSLETASQTYKNNVYLNKKNEIIGEMTLENFENYTDEHLDDMIRVGSLDEVGKAAIQEARADAAFQKIINDITGEGGYDSLSAKNGIANLENTLNNWVTNNIISSTVKDQLLNYGKEIAASPYDLYVYTETLGQPRIMFKIPGASNTTVESGIMITDESTEPNLSLITDPKMGDLYRIDGVYYTRWGDKWYKFSSNILTSAIDSGSIFKIDNAQLPIVSTTNREN